MLQNIDPLSVGILFQNRYRIVRCIKEGPPSAVYDVVDEETNACCLLEVVAAGAVAVENLGDPLAIESRIGGLFEGQQTIKIFEPAPDEEMRQPDFLPEWDIEVFLETNPLPREMLNVDKPKDFVAGPVAPVVPVPIPLPPIPPPLATKPVLPPPPPLCAKPLPPGPPRLPAISLPPPNPPPMRQSLVGLLPPLNPPLYSPLKNGEIIPGDMPPPLVARDSVAQFPPGNEFPHQERIDPLVAAAKKTKVSPSASPRNRLRDSSRRHRGAAVTLAIVFGLLALGLLGLWTHRKQGVPVDETNRSDSVGEAAKSEYVADAPIRTNSRATVSPLTEGASETDPPHAAPDTTTTTKTTKTPDKAVRGTGRTPSPGRKTSPSREPLY